MTSSHTTIKNTFNLAKTLVWPVVIGLAVNLVTSIIAYFHEPHPIHDLWKFLEAMTDSLWISFVAALASFIFVSLRLLHDWRDEFVSAHYSGLYKLASDSNVSIKLKELESIVASGIYKNSPLRSIVLEYMINSIGAMTQNGFAIADSRVDTYVGFISELARRSERVAMTCVVRPYWFVVDAIQGVALAPYIDNSEEYGKGEHLRCFKRKLTGNTQYQRCLIVDESMLAEIMLSAVIDLRGQEAALPDCPYCCGDTVKVNCPFHGARKDFCRADNFQDVPEISWFAEDVNKARGVKLIYTLVSSSWRASCSELDDRVFATSGELNVDLRFTFTSLEIGTMRLYWGEAARKLADINKFNVKVHAETGKEDLSGHKFYNNLCDCVKNESIAPKMIDHLKNLREGVRENFTIKNVAGLGSPEAPKLREYLCDGNDIMQKFLVECVDYLDRELQTNSPLQVYKSLVASYDIIKSAPLVAYVVSLDPIDPRYPVRIARWRINWHGDKGYKGILNASG